MLAYDVAVVGGGISGLSAALNLSLANKNVLVFDTQQPRNLASTRSHGLIGFNKMHPQDIHKHIHDNLKKTQDLMFKDEQVIKIKSNADTNTYTITTDKGSYSVRKVILASGLINDNAQYKAKNVFECPFCESSLITNEPIAIYAQLSNDIRHKVVLLSTWSKHLTVVTDGHDVDNDTKFWLEKHQIELIEDRIVAVRDDEDGHLISLHFADGKETPIQHLFKPSNFNLANILIDEVPLSDHPIKCNRNNRFDVSIGSIQLVGELAQFSHETLLESATFGANIARLTVMQLNQEDFDSRP